MTADRLNRRDAIIQIAAELFTEHGYNATSVRQIADAVGVTEAALYYHFKAGKRELFECVLNCEMPDFEGIIEGCSHVKNLAELVQCIAGQLKETGRQKMERFRWVVSEFPHLSPEERLLFQKRHLAFQSTLTTQFKRFIPDPVQAHYLALIFVCTMFGYGQLFWNMEMENLVDFKPEDLIATFISLLP
jgi:AcrR family transcriptional regulator